MLLVSSQVSTVLTCTRVYVCVCVCVAVQAVKMEDYCISCWIMKCMLCMSASSRYLGPSMASTAHETSAVAPHINQITTLSNTIFRFHHPEHPWANIQQSKAQGVQSRG